MCTASSSSSVATKPQLLALDLDKTLAEKATHPGRLLKFYKESLLRYIFSRISQSRKEVCIITSRAPEENEDLRRELNAVGFPEKSKIYFVGERSDFDLTNEVHTTKIATAKSKKISELAVSYDIWFIDDNPYFNDAVDELQLPNVITIMADKNLSHFNSMLSFSLGTPILIVNISKATTDTKECNKFTTLPNIDAWLKNIAIYINHLSATAQQTQEINKINSMLKEYSEYLSKHADIPPWLLMHLLVNIATIAQESYEFATNRWCCCFCRLNAEVRDLFFLIKTDVDLTQLDFAQLCDYVKRSTCSLKKELQLKGYDVNNGSPNCTSANTISVQSPTECSAPSPASTANVSCGSSSAQLTPFFSSSSSGDSSEEKQPLLPPTSATKCTGITHSAYNE